MSAPLPYDPLTSPVFTERCVFLAQSQFWPAERIADLQLRKLQQLVIHVQQKVPFYAEFLKREGLEWRDFTSLEHVRRFPLINKKLIQESPDAFLAEGNDKRHLIHRSTGGSTGTPLTVWADLDFVGRDKANTEHYMEVFGLDVFSHRSVRLYGDRLDSALIERHEYWRLDEGRKLVMSPYHVSRETTARYVKAIDHHRPRYIHSRASAILPLSRYMTEQGLTATGIDFIFCDGECLASGQRRLIERAFGARVVNVYGHTEGALVGHPCPQSDQLHFMPQVGLLELLDKKGRAVTTPGQRGEMVATGFNNFVFPLIRYQTGDVGIRGAASCECGRHYPLVEEVEGRLQDYVVDARGNVVPLAPAIFNYNDMDWKGIREFKVIQELRGELTLLIEPELDLRARGQAALDALCDRVGGILGGQFRLTASFVDALPKSRIGKYRYLDQRLSVEELEV